MERFDDALQDKILKHGRSLITNFSILVKLTGMYESANEAITSAAMRVLNDMKPLTGEEGGISIKVTDGSFFIEDMRIKATVADIDNFSFLAKMLEQRMVGVLTFQSPLQADDLMYAAYALRRGSSETEIQSALEKHSKSISIGAPVAALREDDIDLKDTRLIAKRSYIRAISSYNNIKNSLKTGRKLNVTKAKRTIQSLVDCILRDESYLLGLTTVRKVDDYGPSHAVNVTVFSIAVGKRLGLSKFQLSRLAMSALFHDIGKIDMPESILNKPAELNQKEMSFLMLHPVEGVKKLLTSRGLNEMSMLSMIVAFEHHLNIDLSGYPVISRERSPNVFSRIIRIADEFDSLVSGRVYDRKSVNTETALKVIASKGGELYDPVMVKAFIGIFA